MSKIHDTISQIGVVPVIKLNHPERDAAALGKALCAGGVPVAEITFRAEGADTAIKLMKEACPEMLVGAGTVTTTEQIDKVLEVGGEFIVTPCALYAASTMSFGAKPIRRIFRNVRRPERMNSA